VTSLWKVPGLDGLRLRSFCYDNAVIKRAGRKSIGKTHSSPCLPRMGPLAKLRPIAFRFILAVLESMNMVSTSKFDGCPVKKAFAIVAKKTWTP